MIKSEAVDDFICKLQRYKNNVGNKDCKMSLQGIFLLCAKIQRPH